MRKLRQQAKASQQAQIDLLRRLEQVEANSGNSLAFAAIKEVPHLR
jgi:hypothetical protein